MRGISQSSLEAETPFLPITDDTLTAAKSRKKKLALAALGTSTLLVAGLVMLVVYQRESPSATDEANTNSTPFSSAAPANAPAPSCLGQFEQCSTTLECVLDPSDCGHCSNGQYLCPDKSTCADNADGYLQCSGIKGTHLDWTLPIEKRLDYLVEQTTLDEQIAQLTNDAPAIPRLNVPAFNYLNDDEHGVKQNHATSFPNGNCLGATWSKETLFDVGHATALEARALYNAFTREGDRGHGDNGKGITLYAPNLNLVRDPRWGRAQEVYSEDPLLTSRLTYEFVTGIQGNETYWLGGACCKHFAAYDLESIPESRFTFDAQVNVRNMHETYLPAFKACIVEAEGSHVMCSYNAINGVPACANKDLLDGILRDQWGFDGFVVSDYDAWSQIFDTHHYCEDYTCAAAAGLNAGMDQEGGGTNAITHLAEAIEQGQTQKEKVGEAMRRLFRVRMRLGMFDPPSMVNFNNVRNETVVESPEHIQLARKAAQEGIVLLKNDRNVLPLAPKANTIALIGPQIPQEFLLLGNYAVMPDHGISSILEGVIENLSESAPKCEMETDVDYFQPGQPGIDAVSPEDCCVMCTAESSWCKYWTFYEGQCYLKKTNDGKQASGGRTSGACSSDPLPVTYSPGCQDIACGEGSRAFDDAINAAKSASAVVVTVGLDQQIEAEFLDRPDYDLPEGQYALVTALRQALPDTPIVVVAVHGGTFTLGSLLNDADAILDAGYPGMEGGRAVADVLFGTVSPAGRTSVTYYASVEDLPDMGTMDFYPSNSSQGLTYRYFEGKPTIPFGHGLSYTNFSYSDIGVSPATVTKCQSLRVSVQVTNTGTVTSDEVVQLYIQTPDASIPTPQVRLGDFTRLKAMKPQETREVTLTATPEFFCGVVMDDPTSKDIYTATQTVEAGTLRVSIGGGQPGYYEGALSFDATIRDTYDLDQC